MVGKSGLVSRVITGWPLRKRFGFYAFLPLFFCCGAVVEYLMIHLDINSVNFYKIYGQKLSQQTLQQQLRNQKQLKETMTKEVTNNYVWSSGTSGTATAGQITNWSNCQVSGGNSRRPKPVFFWNNADVMKWLKRHCEQYYGLYGHAFLENEITGRSLVRITECTLERMGISDATHRDDICRIILKLKLKSDIIEIKDLEKKSESGIASSVTTGIS
ncbi:unnamed protein product [Medioppia subpectinata]|uniref:SAM domain-containing protein n=1 Tax=Medioppia subpectinata TaxID=1979941 RepID=A0A7R9KEG1_9ACAR|nr:unnamed protein product [Medioppia subpectinata]CAG2100631.1 unnamed protein product [Medioppia subpectinata]